MRVIYGVSVFNIVIVMTTALTSCATQTKPDRPPDAVQCIAINPDGKVLAMVETKGAIRLYDLVNKQDIRSFAVGASQREAILDVVFSPNGESIAIAGFPHRLELWDFAKGTRLLNYDGHSGYVGTVLFSKDGKTLFSCGKDAALFIWDAATGKEKGRLPGHPPRGSVNGIALAGNETLLISATFNHEIKLWDIEGKREIASFENDDIIYSLQGSRDGKTVLSAGRAGIFLWDVGTRKRIVVYENQGKAASSSRACFSPDGEYVLGERGGGTGTIWLWEARTGRRRCSFQFDEGILGCVFTPDGKKLVGCNRKGEVSIWNVVDLVIG